MKKNLLIAISLLMGLSAFGQSLTRSWKDLPYADDTMIYHRLDIYLPDEVKPSYPVIVSIYGSAWLSNRGKGSDLNPLGKALLKAGFAVVTPNHRSSFDAKFPAPLQDIKAAIRFVKAQGNRYNLDTTFFGVVGSSSGGNLAAMAGTTRNIRKGRMGTFTVDLEGSVGPFTAYSSSVDAVTDWFGPTNMLVMDSCGGTYLSHNKADSPASLYIGGPIQENKEKTLLASPMTYADPTDPPFLIFHGLKDNVVPHCQSELLFEALQNVHVSSQLTLVPEGGHGPGTQIEPYLSQMTRFFLEELKNKQNTH